MDLTTFLLERIAEDEAAARLDAGATGQLKRLICRVKRRQVRRCADRPEPFAIAALHEIAADYADHPDYRQEWAL